MRTYISVADAAECMQRRGQGVRGSRCGSGWVRASSGRTELCVDVTGGAQDWVGCHGHDIRGHWGKKLYLKKKVGVKKKTCFKKKKKVGKIGKKKKHYVHKKKLGWKKKSWGEKKHCGQKSWAELKNKQTLCK